MNLKKIKLYTIILLIYWCFSFIALLDVINSTGTLFPYWLDKLLFPGYFLGFIFGFIGGEFLAIITLIILLSNMKYILSLLINQINLFNSFFLLFA